MKLTEKKVVFLVQGGVRFLYVYIYQHIYLWFARTLDDISTNPPHIINEENAIREEVEFIFKNIESQNNPIWNKSSHHQVDV